MRIEEVLADQAGIVSRTQALAAGLAPHDVRRLLRRREWAVVHTGVYLDHTGPPTWLQRAWAGICWAGGPTVAALAHQSALRAAEGPGRRDPAREGTIHVAIDHSRRVRGAAGVQVHRVRGLDELVRWNLGPPRVRYEDAALDVAIDMQDRLSSLSVVAAACQTRHTTAGRLLERLERRERTPDRVWLTRVLQDVAEGTCSVLEHGYLHRVELAHALPRARRQVRATASVGVVYRDAEYPLGLLLELDGRLHHDTVGQRDRDYERDLDAALDGHDTRRLTYGQVFGRPCSTAGKIGLLLQQRGWSGSIRRCSDGCTAGVGKLRATG